MRNERRRTTIIEDPQTKDCIFLQTIGGQRVCAIYTARPNQCRTWPFWSRNLSSPDAWNRAAQRCPGINRGRLYDHDEIERLKD
jgi:Fe-S-cluster containining protein